MEQWAQLAKDAAPAADAWSVRFVTERLEQLTVRRDAPEAPWRQHDAGAMVSVTAGGGQAYAATSDLSAAGLRAAFGRARELALACAAHSLVEAHDTAPPALQGRYASPTQRPVEALGLREKYELLSSVCASANLGPAIVDRNASLWTTRTEQLFVTGDGGHIEQHWDFVVPGLSVVASEGGETQTRSAAGQYNGFCQQGGLEVLERARFASDGPRVAREA